MWWGHKDFTLDQIPDRDVASVCNVPAFRFVCVVMHVVPTVQVHFCCTGKYAMCFICVVLLMD